MVIKVDNSIKVVLALFFCFVFSLFAQAQVAEPVVFQEPQVFEKQLDNFEISSIFSNYEEPIVNIESSSLLPMFIIADANLATNTNKVTSVNKVNSTAKVNEKAKVVPVKKTVKQTVVKKEAKKAKKTPVKKESVAAQRAAAQDRQATKVYQKGFTLYQNKE